MSRRNINQILALFDIPDDDYDVTSIKHGMINRSYAVSRSSSMTKQYFLQQIDHSIFKDIEGLMANIKVVTDHFITLENAPNYLSTINSKNGLNYLETKEGEYWRLYNYVEGETHFRAENTLIAAEAGANFGEFLNALVGLESTLLITTIPRFHDIELRYEQFQTSLKEGNSERKMVAKGLIQLVKDNIEKVKDIYLQIISECPSRPTHNDTKLSNLLFDNEDRGICVVDYDTIMPGYWPLDFGDSVRTLCSTTVEDDKDFENTRFEMSIFIPFAEHFISKLAPSLTESEKALFPKSVPYMQFLMGLRMLTDYLNNDTYYSTHYDNHNFDRASNQFALYMSGMELQPEINNIVNNIIRDIK